MVRSTANEETREERSSRKLYYIAYNVTKCCRRERKPRNHSQTFVCGEKFKVLENHLSGLTVDNWDTWVMP